MPCLMLKRIFPLASNGGLITWQRERETKVFSGTSYLYAIYHMCAIISFDTILSTCYPITVSVDRENILTTHHPVPALVYFRYYVFKSEFNDIDKVFQFTHSHRHFRLRPHASACSLILVHIDEKFIEVFQDVGGGELFGEDGE